jgi:hypothetical protein
MNRGRCSEPESFSPSDELLPAAGLPNPTSDPIVHYAPTMQVQVSRAHRIPAALG